MDEEIQKEIRPKTVTRIAGHFRQTLFHRRLALTRLAGFLSRSESRVYVRSRSSLVWHRAMCVSRGYVLSAGHISNRLSKIAAYVAARSCGEIIDTWGSWKLLPQGLYFTKPLVKVPDNRFHTGDDAGILYLDPPDMTLPDEPDFKKGKEFLSITFRPSPLRPQDPFFYSTSVTNITLRRVRILRFGYYSPCGEQVLLHTANGGFFKSAQFEEWYKAQDGWIIPGRMMVDPRNYGGRDGWWVYFGKNDLGEEFTAGARPQI